MVRTPRHESAPQQLVRNKARWTPRWEEMCAGTKKADWATRAAKKALHPALGRLAHGKCVFCESLLGVTTPLQIEHYVAKTLRPDLAFEWTNLLPACRECNGAKSDADHQGALLKPDEEDPEPYFWINAGTGELEPHPRLDEAGRQRALQTIAICNLQRGPLCVKRLDTWQRAGDWLNKAAAHPDERERLLNPRTEYKLATRQAFERGARNDLAAEDRRRFEAPPQTTSSLTGSQRTLRSRR
ncbi:MAG: hypothetical protein FJW34_21905 [Acidobacteria bacterium]|nr:hypothetical protein [Acidobacteriota bacterium]